MFRFLIVSLVVLCFTPLQSQVMVDTIKVEPSPFNSIYIYKNQTLHTKDLILLLENVPAAKAELAKFQTFKTISLTTSLSAMGILIWALLPNTPEATRETLGYTFIGLELTTIPFSIGKRIHKRKAVDAYNQYLLYGHGQ